jgi:hypothetical protein
MSSAYRKTSIAIALVLLLGAPSASSEQIGAMDPTASDAFADSIGVDTHFNYPGTPYTVMFPAISADLIGSGIRHIRDGAPKYSRPATLAYLGQHGVKHSLGFLVGTTSEEIEATIKSNAPYVDFVEPQNELDVRARAVPDWVNRWRSEQELLYKTVRSNPENAGITVVGPAIGHYANAAELGPMDQFEDVGSMHQYPCNVNPGDVRSNVGFAKVLIFQRLIHTTRPIWTTEIGYPDDLPDGRCALTDGVIAKYDTRTLAERWLAHQPRTYFYQFSDMGNVRGYDSMGFVTTNGTPKPQYRALQSLLRLVADPGPPFAPTSMKYSLTGQTDNVHQLLLEKRDKSYLLLLWLEVPSWDSVARTPRDVPMQTVRINLSAIPKRAEQFAYGPDWAFQKTTLVPSNAVDVSVTDSISIVTLRP